MWEKALWVVIAPFHLQGQLEGIFLDFRLCSLKIWEEALGAVFASFHLEGTICGWWDIKDSTKFCTILLILSRVFTLYVVCLQAMLAASASRKSAKKKKKKAGKVLAENAEAGDGSDWMEQGLPSNIFQPVLPWPGKTERVTRRNVWGRGLWFC